MPGRRGIRKRRPAETVAAGGGLAGLVAAIAAHNTLAAVTAAVGFVPAVVTYLFDHGGLAGVAGRLLHGGDDG